MGSYLPDRRLTNRDLERMVETNDAWIVERTGIRCRRIAAPGQATTDLALHAATRALEAAATAPSEIDGIIFATVTSERIMPAAACALQAKLGCRAVMAFDVSAACSGFLYGLSLADSLIKSQQFKKILVVGAETLSRIMDYTDRETCILFGDAAGAFVVGPTEEDAATSSRFLSFHLAADGLAGDHLTLAGMARDRSLVPEGHLGDPGPYVHMRGREVFRAAVKAMSERCREAMQANAMRMDQVDWFIPHQANIRIIEAVGKQIDAIPERVISNLAEVGNTSSASIPLAFDEAARAGRIRRGQSLLLTAFGAGLTSAAVMLRY
jgi:3-oxoacyl-[acyl-carrier-protein] synthase-3